jgi:hypothetical protein
MLANLGIMDYSALVGIEGKKLNIREAMTVSRITTGSFYARKAKGKNNSFTQA